MSTSVVIATFNGEKYIYDQLKSILEQVDKNTEIIISDNGSTDKTLEIINAFNDGRIRLYHFKRIRGVNSNFENALKHATGEIIFLSDQDDIWLPGKFTTCIAYLEENDIIVTDCNIINENNEIVEISLFSKTNAQKGLLKNVLHNTYLGCCIALKKKILAIALPFPKNIPMHDIWIGFVAELFFKPFFLKEPLLLYRRHSNNFSSTSGKSKYNILAKFKFRYNLIKYIPLLIKRKIACK